MMTKILAYHVRDDEQPFIDEWVREHHIQVDSVTEELHDDTVALAKGYDGVDFKQRSLITDKPDLYEKLHAYGISQLSARSAGIDTLNLDWAKANGIRVSNVPSYSPRAVAELVLTQAMQLIRHIPEFRARFQDNNYVVDGLRSRELSELTIGIIGVGRIGSAVARIFHALGATVLGNDITKPREDLKGVLRYTTKDEIYRIADVVTVHVYYSEKNHHLVGKDEFAKLKPSAFFINDSRGHVIDTVAFRDALLDHQFAGGGLDVVENETQVFNQKFADETPVPLYNELKQIPNLLLTPHIGFFTDHAVRNMVVESLDDTLAFLENRPTEHEIHF